jgi:Tfp pilus assembly protein PilO
MAFQTPSIQSVYQNKQLNSPLSQIILMLIVIVLFSWFLFKPKLTTVIENRKVLTAAKSQLASVDNEKRELNRLVQQLQSASSEVKLTEEALPLSGRTSKPHILLDSLAKSSGMVVVQITPDDTDNIISAGNKAVLADPYKAARALNESMYTVSVTGTIDQFKNYLQLLETNGRVLDISTLEIVGGDPVTKFRIKIKTYSYEAI